MKIDIDDYRVEPGGRFKLRRRPTRIRPVYGSRDEYEKMLGKHTAELSELQDRLYADNRFALLLIFQAMDAAGKDGAIRHVMSGINPQGCQVYAFKQPSAEELDHDFLWRAMCRLPERGRIGIFNRSYYEEVLVVRVHRELLERQQLPGRVDRESIWEERYRSILDFEEHLRRNGTRIVKFHLNLSKDEQRRRFLRRIDAPEKNWKFSLADVAERSYWKDYARAYEECLRATSTKHAPWYVVPADDKRTARLIISEVILGTLRALDLTYPKVTAARRRELLALRRQLAR